MKNRLRVLPVKVAADDPPPDPLAALEERIRTLEVELLVYRQLAISTAVRSAGHARRLAALEAGRVARSSHLRRVQ